uniref:CYTB_CTER domain-containing protein n=1 Tax=Ascaris lumbricoides TaxID=6252 RepID=A0A0M3IIR4_ASCLU
MFQLLIVGYVVFEIYRLSSLPDVGSYAPPPPQQVFIPGSELGQNPFNPPTGRKEDQLIQTVIIEVITSSKIYPSILK